MNDEVINAVAEFERDLLIERTSGSEPSERAGQGPRATAKPDRGAEAGGSREAGEGASVSKLSRDYGVSRQTIQRAPGGIKNFGTRSRA